MANYFNLALDTTGPASPTISIDTGSAYATSQLVNVGIATTDTPTTGYQMKIWGNVDPVYDANVQTLEENSVWVTFAATKQIKLLSGDGSKTIYAKIRDDVYNESSQVSDSIILDSSLPIVTIAGPDVNKISKQTGKNSSAFTFQSDTAFVEYKVKVVSATGAAENTGTTIPTTNGSTNMAAIGSFASATPISCTIKGADLEFASSGDATKIIKVFVKESSGLWSI